MHDVRAMVPNKLANMNNGTPIQSAAARNQFDCKTSARRMLGNFCMGLSNIAKNTQDAVTTGVSQSLCKGQEVVLGAVKSLATD